MKKNRVSRAAESREAGRESTAYVGAAPPAQSTCMPSANAPVPAIESMTGPPQVPLGKSRLAPAAQASEQRACEKTP